MPPPSSPYETARPAADERGKLVWVGASVESVREAGVEAWGNAKRRLDRFTDWRRRLASEVSELPDTMRSLREGAANFELVAARLAKSSESLEDVAELYQSTIVESGRRSAQVVDTLRTQVDKLADASTTPDQMSQSLADAQRAFESMAELNPFWPRKRRTT